MYESVDKAKRKKIWFLILGGVIVLSIGIIYWQNRSISKEEANRTKMEEQLALLATEIKSLKQQNYIVTSKKDSLQNNLNYLWQYKPLVQASKFRDDVGANFNFHPGDRVRLKSDSSLVVLTDILIGGNRYNYFIKFIAKNTKGMMVELTPLEIEKIN
jgi:hypothetical protein